MRQIIKRTIFSLIILLFISIITTSEIEAKSIPSVIGILIRVDQEQKQFIVKPDGSEEVALTWTKESVLLLDKKTASIGLFANRATGKRVEIAYFTQQGETKVIQNARIIQ